LRNIRPVVKFFKAYGNLPIVLEGFKEHCTSKFKKLNLEDVNMEPVGLGNTRVLVDYVQKSLHVLDYYPLECESDDCIWVDVF
jgi:hypothetical protein